MDETETPPLPNLVTAGVERTMELARSWLGWDGTPCIREDPERIYTPHKSIRRYADHLVDHLAHIEALVAGVETVPDEWRASLVTTDADWAHFTEADLNEAGQRLRRLALVYAVRLTALGPAQWDAPRGTEWTIREIVEHVSGPWYAEQVGMITPRS